MTAYLFEKLVFLILFVSEVFKNFTTYLNNPELLYKICYYNHEIGLYILFTAYISTTNNSCKSSKIICINPIINSLHFSCLMQSRCSLFSTM